MLRPFYSDAKKAKNVSFFFFLLLPLRHTLFPRNFSGTVADIINTPLEPLRPADVPFGGYKTETKDLKGIFCRKIDFWR